MHYALIGIGINANLDACDLPPDVARTATTLRTLLARETDLDDLLRVLSRNVLAALDTSRLDSSALDAVAACLYARGATARIRTLSGDVIEGTLEGVNADGVAIVRSGEQSHAGSLVSAG